MQPAGFETAVRGKQFRISKERLMKRPHLSQIIPYTLSGIALALVLALLGGLIRLPAGGRPETRQAAFREIPLEPEADSAAATLFDQQKSGPSRDEDINIRIYQMLNEAVVNITAVSVDYNWFLEPVPHEGTGSGSILDQQGHVLTNYHVVKQARELGVTLADGTNFKGEVVGADPENDLAIIKFDPGGKKLSTVIPGSSADLRVGQKVLAIGNPFALDRTLTTGIVSGVGRPVRVDSDLVIQEMIQTDASINPGNSGGPLLDSRGEMIGINTVIYSPSGGSVGIGFAVPVDTAKRVIPDLLRYGKVQRGWIDITPVQIFPELVRYADLRVSEGILVSEVAPGSTAEKAGLRGGQRQVRHGRSIIHLGGDIITEIDGTPVASLADLLASLEDNKPGDTVEVKIIRGGKKMSLDVELSPRPDNVRL
jgi:S1-C subfamily serine protease